MGLLRKIRVAVPGRITPVAAVRAEVAAAVGQFPRVDLQEIEGEGAVIELALARDEGLPEGASDLRRVVAARCPVLDVLSAWDEEDDVRPGVLVGDRWQLHDPGADLTDFPVAVRAVLDGVPSAEWRPREGCWALAVPCTLEGGRRAVAVARRHGYLRRFPVPPATAWRAGRSSAAA